MEVLQQLINTQSHLFWRDPWFRIPSTPDKMQQLLRNVNSWRTVTLEEEVTLEGSDIIKAFTIFNHCLQLIMTDFNSEDKKMCLASFMVAISNWTPTELSLPDVYKFHSVLDDLRKNINKHRSIKYIDNANGFVTALITELNNFEKYDADMETILFNLITRIKAINLLNKSRGYGISCLDYIQIEGRSQDGDIKFKRYNHQALITQADYSQFNICNTLACACCDLKKSPSYLNLNIRFHSFDDIRDGKQLIHEWSGHQQNKTEISPSLVVALTEHTLKLIITLKNFETRTKRIKRYVRKLFHAQFQQFCNILHSLSINEMVISPLHEHYSEWTRMIAYILKFEFTANRRYLEKVQVRVFDMLIISRQQTIWEIGRLIQIPCQIPLD